METLESWVSDAFSGVPNNGLPPDDFKTFSNLAFNTLMFNKMYWLKPVKDVCEVSISLVLSPPFVDLCCFALTFATYKLHAEKLWKYIESLGCLMPV